MTLREFLLTHRTADQDEFVKRFNHAFLVINTAPDSEVGTAHEFHTKAAGQAKELLRRAQDQAQIHPLHNSRGNGLAKITVGRTSINDIVLPHDAISKFHAYFRKGDASHYRVYDPGSKNGTTVNGRPLSAGNALTLEGGETIVFGQAIEATFHTPRSLFQHLRMLRLWTDS